MSKPIVQRLIAALIVATVLTASFATLVSAAVPSAPVAQTVRAKQVRGTLTGGQFAKIWLGLEPEQFGSQITVISEWDRADAAQNGVGFFILDEQGLPGAIAGEALNDIAIAAGTASFVQNGPSNTLGASLNAFGLSRYTIIVYNDSNSDANFTLTATNGFISDDSGQVTDPNATQVVTTTATTTTTAPVTVAPVTTTAATTTTTTAPVAATTGTTTSTTPAVTVPAAAPVAVVPTQPGVVTAAQLQGDLPEQNDQHFLGLKPTQRDAEISLSLTFDPQDSSELARRLNFWVLDQAGFAQFQAGANPSEVAIAAGNRTFRADTNERVANFKAVGEGEYVVLVYNTSQVPGSYTISATGGLLSDDSGQTRTAQLAAVSNTATTTATTTTVATTATTPAPVAATTATTSTAATTTAAAGARTGTPGGTYTVKSGDTIALIARDIYGDYQLYQQICTFNGLTDCNVIEVGDVIKLPTQAQISAGATQPAAAAAPVATATRAATTAATTATTATTTAGTTTATNAVTNTTTATRTTTVAPTTTVTRTGTVTPTNTTTTTSGATGANIVDTAIANGGFKTLVAALDATGLDTTLRGAGPFTVFAPTDAAFAALPAGALDRLLADPSGQLTDILRYHVIANELTTADLSDDLEATTVQGKPVKFDVQGNTIQINGATILTKDIQTSNGVIQVIDAVIIPPAE